MGLCMAIFPLVALSAGLCLHIPPFENDTGSILPGLPLSPQGPHSKVLGLECQHVFLGGQNSTVNTCDLPSLQTSGFRVDLLRLGGLKVLFSKNQIDG